MDERQKNADRFTGFADVYDAARPAMPKASIEYITRYLAAQGRSPKLAVDLGSGTGLSALAWAQSGAQVVGIEPSGDMLLQARKKESDWLTFKQAYANDTGLPDGCADAVVCSQSFHWMEPKSTLAEVNRILAPGGVFATVDCDWPPVCDYRAEQRYMRLYASLRELEESLPELKETFHRYSKEHHLQNLEDSGYFCYCREILFANRESCTANRLIALLLSQGSLQTAKKLYPQLILPLLEQFEQEIHRICGEESFSVDFCYRMRIGVKA